MTSPIVYGQSVGKLKRSNIEEAAQFALQMPSDAPELIDVKMLSATIDYNLGHMQRALITFKEAEARQAKCQPDLRIYRHSKSIYGFNDLLPARVERECWMLQLGVSLDGIELASAAIAC